MPELHFRIKSWNTNSPLVDFDPKDTPNYLNNAMMKMKIHKKCESETLPVEIQRPSKFMSTQISLPAGRGAENDGLLEAHFTLSELESNCQKETEKVRQFSLKSATRRQHELKEDSLCKNAPV